MMPVAAPMAARISVVAPVKPSAMRRLISFRRSSRSLAKSFRSAAV